MQLSTASQYRAEARSLSLTAERVHPADADRYYQAASRCARVANLIESGTPLEVAAAIACGLLEGSDN